MVSYVDCEISAEDHQTTDKLLLADIIKEKSATNEHLYRII